MSTRNLSIENLNVWYGDRQILHDVTLDIPDRQITAIIGPSGCGKTTLMRCMNRLLEVNTEARTEGKILLDGKNIFDPGTEVTSIRKKMGLLSQRPQVLPMSIYDNVAYGLRIHGLRKKAELARLVEKNLRACSLWDEVNDRLNSPATGLSIGQQQRLCLARGLAVEPEIILGDEPTSALDPQASQNIEQLLVHLKKDYTIVLVTHILRQAKRIADHVIFLYMGKVIETGPVGEVLNHPREDLTKRYIAGIIS